MIQKSRGVVTPCATQQARGLLPCIPWLCSQVAHRNGSFWLSERTLSAAKCVLLYPLNRHRSHTENLPPLAHAWGYPSSFCPGHRTGPYLDLLGASGLCSGGSSGRGLLPFPSFRLKGSLHARGLCASLYKYSGNPISTYSHHLHTLLMEAVCSANSSMLSALLQKDVWTKGLVEHLMSNA